MSRGFHVAQAFELAVVRHGRTAWNADGRFQGQSDVPLDAQGRAQAAALGRALVNDRYHVAVASDLERARETARIVLGARNLPLDLDPRWREMHFGTWEGLTWAQIVERQPELAERGATTPRFYTPPEGESFDDVCARVSEALAALAVRLDSGGRALVVTHAGVLHALLRVALGESEAAALGVKFAPGTVTRLALGAAGSEVLQLNWAPPGVRDVPA